MRGFLNLDQHYSSLTTSLHQNTKESVAMNLLQLTITAIDYSLKYIADFGMLKLFRCENTQISELTNSLKTSSFAKDIELNKNSQNRPKLEIEESANVAEEDDNKRMDLDNYEHFMTNLNDKEIKANPYFKVEA
jgi:hypothetical protein